jgi:hypothetical protein
MRAKINFSFSLFYLLFELDLLEQRILSKLLLFFCSLKRERERERFLTLFNFTHLDSKQSSLSLALSNSLIIPMILYHSQRLFSKKHLEKLYYFNRSVSCNINGTSCHTCAIFHLHILLQCNSHEIFFIQVSAQNTAMSKIQNNANLYRVKSEINSTRIYFFIDKTIGWAGTFIVCALRCFRMSIVRDISGFFICCCCYC